ncbi:MAG: response regulator transcription factor, partial [Gaiellales bacterium]
TPKRPCGHNCIRAGTLAASASGEVRILPLQPARRAPIIVVPLSVNGLSLSRMSARVPSAFLSSAAWSAIGASLKLSARELQIVTCIVEDLAETQDDVGRHLGMSPHTVHTHLERLYKKLGVANRSRLMVRVFAEYVHLEAAAGKRL